MYVGMVLGLLGIAVHVGTLPFYLAALAQFCILNFGFIPFEEEKSAGVRRRTRQNQAWAGRCPKVSRERTREI
jgi:hypothetical protein